MTILQKLKNMYVQNKTLYKVALFLIASYVLVFIFPHVSFLLTFCAFSGICCIIYGLLIHIHKNCKKPYSIIAFSLKILANLLIVVFLLSMTVIQFNIFSGMKDTEEKCDYVLLLGASTRNNKPSKAAIYRINRVIDYLEKYPDTKIVICGGLGTEKKDPESVVMKRYMIEHGVDESLIITEEKSHDTTRNIKYAKEIIEQKGNDINDYKIGIATSGYHIYRSLIIADKAGIENPCALVAKNPGYIAYNLSCHLREYFSVILEYLNL